MSETLADALGNEYGTRAVVNFRSCEWKLVRNDVS